jgi:hypothetical protein
MHPLATSLGKAERDLLREVEPKRLAKLDEDGLVALHGRIRRARTKYVGQYRRQGSAKVAAKGGRGLAKERNARNAGRAEVFEDALARVSAALADAAAAQAEELRAARLAAASTPGTWPGSDGATPGGDTDASPQVADRTPKGPGREKRNASTQAKGARRQAKRDSKGR